MRPMSVTRLSAAEVVSFPVLGICTKSDTRGFALMFCVCSDCSLRSSTGQPLSSRM